MDCWSTKAAAELNEAAGQQELLEVAGWAGLVKLAEPGEAADLVMLCGLAWQPEQTPLSVTLAGITN